MITATFLDEINVELPAANWGSEEWTRDFATMKADGIDTVVLARGGVRDRATFDSKTLRTLHPNLIVQQDLVALFLSLAEQHDMSLWFGTYQSGPAADGREVETQHAFVGEVWERYGRSRAFRGWYVSRAVDTANEREVEALRALTRHLSALSALPVLVAPKLERKRALDNQVAWREHEQTWADALEAIRGSAGVVLLEESGVPSSELPEYLAQTSKLAAARGFSVWANVESFDRDVRIQYPPIAWPKLRYKIEAALRSGVGKIVTNEYSHFLSPHSMFNSAHMLHRRYREWLATQK
jgi:hypothetical protein